MRPLVDTGAMVFVVFGIVGINRTQQMDNHVIGDPVRPLGTGVEGPGCSSNLENWHLCMACPSSPSHTLMPAPEGTLFPWRTAQN